jgi:hypothetical protein
MHPKVLFGDAILSTYTFSRDRLVDHGKVYGTWPDQIHYIYGVSTGGAEGGISYNNISGAVLKREPTWKDSTY